MNLGEHLSFSQAAYVLLSLPCVIKCLVDLMGAGGTSLWRSLRGAPDPDRSAVRGTQTLDANGHFIRKVRP